jgi:hypothetical protein
MSDLTDTPGIVALAAAAVAVLALGWAIACTIQIRRLRADQRAVLGDGSREDLVAHAAALQQGFLDLRDWVEEMADGLDERVGVAEERLDGAITHRSLVRYDAYGELSGHQSSTIALLDARRNGVILSAIAHRDFNRLYCKQVIDGRGELELSPEEVEAVRLALAGEVGSRILEA